MKKIIFSAAVLALAAIGAFKATSTNDYAFNELQMGNIEMLAQGESGVGLCCLDIPRLCYYPPFYSSPDYCCEGDFV